MVTVPQHPLLWGTFDESAFYKRRYTRRELNQKVERAGFQNIWCTSFVSFLMPLMFLVRIKKSKSEFDLFEELKIGSFLNQVFLKIMSLEISFVRRDLSLPTGGSLLLIGQKG